MAEKTAVDELSDWDFFKKMMTFFGVRRATEIFGYAAIIGASGKVLPSEIVAILVPFGFSRAGVYRALSDIRAFVRELEHERGRTMSMEEVIAEMNSAGTSRKRETMV